MKEERNYCVYMHVFPNGKRYIGITGMKPEYRWANGKGYKNCYKMQHAIQKYGWENVGHIILFKNLTKIEAEWKEKFLIKYYDTKNNGYNIASGGYVNSGFKRTEEFKQNMSGEKNHRYGKRFFGKDNPNYGNHKLKGRKMPENQRLKLIESLKNSEKFQRLLKYQVGENNPNYRNHLSLEQKENMSKKIIFNNKIFNSIIEFSKEYNLNRNVVGAWLNKREKMPQKYIDGNLRFYGDNETVYESNRFKKVLCDNKIFYTIKECADYYSVDYSRMRKWLNKEQNVPKFFIDKKLRYFDEKDDKINYNKQKFNNKKVTIDGIIFNSINEMSKYLNTNRSKFSMYLSGKAPMPKKWKDRGLAYYEENEN